jgi:putative phosphoribosyl transferase
MTFESREDAGRRLGIHLRDAGVEVELVLGLPRGGVVVAAEVARVFQRPLGALVVRKIGHPSHREFAIGAMAERDVLLLDESLAGSNPEVREKLREVIREETQRLVEYEKRFHCGARQELSGRKVLLVDDGLATGTTMEAAVLSARSQAARRIVVAVPVASLQAMEKLQHVADEVVAFVVDPDFDAVGRYYDFFPQTSDEEVVALLRSAECAPT